MGVTEDLAVLLIVLSFDLLGDAFRYILDPCLLM